MGSSMGGIPVSPLLGPRLSAPDAEARPAGEKTKGGPAPYLRKWWIRTRFLRGPSDPVKERLRLEVIEREDSNPRRGPKPLDPP